MGMGLTIADDLIRISVNGEQVEGRVLHVSIANIQVEITYPYSEVSKRCHIPYFALPPFQYEQDGALTPHGQHAAKQLLLEVCEACLFVEMNEDDLILDCQQFLERGTWVLFRNALADADFSEGWYLFPVFVLMFFMTDWQVVQMVQDQIREKFGCRLPEDLVRRLLVRARWLADQG